MTTRLEALREVVQVRLCAQPGCSVLVPRGYCRTHTVRPNVDVRRWYRIARWFRLRDQVLVDAAYSCARCGTVTLALEVDHIQKHEGNPALFWNAANLQALCSPCHIAKTKRGG